MWTAKIKILQKSLYLSTV